ncbi:MAG: hypothetical protein WDM88_13300 [Galbitalea sp.]
MAQVGSRRGGCRRHRGGRDRRPCRGKRVGRASGQDPGRGPDPRRIEHDQGVLGARSRKPSDLGLPSLPTSGNSPAAQSGLASDLALLTGANSLRVYVDGPDKARLQSLTSLAERDVILNGSDVLDLRLGHDAVSHAVLDASDHPSFRAEHRPRPPRRRRESPPRSSPSSRRRVP